MDPYISYDLPEQKWYSAYPLQDPLEFERLCQLVRSIRPKWIMEVGSRFGQSLIRLAEASMPALEGVVIMDRPDYRPGKGGNSIVGCIDHLRERGLQVEAYLMNSHYKKAYEAVERFRGKIDFLFIDGDHRYKGVKQDWDWFSQCVRPGGVIAIHDVAFVDDPKDPSKWPIEVPVFWSELKIQLPAGSWHEWVNPGSGKGIGLVIKR